MHELSLMKSLMSKIQSIAAEQGARRVVRVRLKLGAMGHISPDHLRGHFVEAARGTSAEGAELDIQELHDPLAQEILLDSIEVEA